MLDICGLAASLAARLVNGFAGVIWSTVHKGEAGEWLVAAGEAPLWNAVRAGAAHPWSAREPLFRVPVPGANPLTIVTSREECAGALLEVAALLSACSLSTTAPRLRQVLESTQDGVFLLDRQWRFTYMNQPGAALLAASAEDLIGLVVWDAFPEAVGSRFQQAYERVFATGEPESFEEFFAPLDTWFLVNAFLSGDELAVLFRDVTLHHRERERLEKVESELRAALTSLQRITDQSLDLIVTWDVSGNLVSVSAASRRILGYDPGDLVGRRFFDLVVPEDREATAQAVEAVLANGRLDGFQSRYRHRDGHTVHLQWSANWSNEDQLGLSIARDITATVAAEASLRESEERYRLIFNENPQLMWMYDEQSLQLLDVNRAALAAYGYSREEFLKLTVLDLVHPQELEQAHAVLVRERRPGPRSGVWKHVRKDHCAMTVQGWSHPLPIQGHSARLAVAFDVTRQQALEKQLRQAQKMEAVGELAGGIAHDFNNLLTVINGYAEIALKHAVGSPAEPMITAIQQAGRRAAELTQQLLAFSRRQVLQPDVFNLNDTVLGMRAMLRRVVPESVDMLYDLAPDLAPVRADATQIEQVLLNLVLNARDACEGRTGRIAIESRNTTVEGELAARTGLTPGPYALVAVTDSGCGMDTATCARIFEPFFTTKQRGRGTGLGLPMSYGIVKQSGGHISVYSEPGVGTSVKVYLPAAPGLQPQPAAPVADGLALAPGGRETILLVEDSEQVRTFTRLVLEQLGYHVLEAGDGSAALELSASFGQEIHLLLTDVILPRLSGREVALRLAPQRPRMKVLFISGYTENAIVHHGVLDPGLNYLAKPFSPEALARKVRDVLDQPQRPRCVLLASPPTGARRQACEALRKAGYEIIEAAQSADALKLTRRRAVDLIVSWLAMPGYSPSEELAFFRQEFRHIRIIAIGDADTGLPADHFLTGGDPADLLSAVRGLIG